MRDFYAINGWYTYSGDLSRVPQAGILQLKDGVVEQGFIYDSRWGYADVHSGRLSDDALEFVKDYGDGSDRVLYTMAPRNNHWHGTWRAEKHDGEADLWIARIAVVTPEIFSFARARAIERPRRMD